MRRACRPTIALPHSVRAIRARLGASPHPAAVRRPCRRGAFAAASERCAVRMFAGGRSAGPCGLPPADRVRFSGAEFPDRLAMLLPARTRFEW